MLDLHAVREQLEAFHRFRVDEARLRSQKLERALAALAASGPHRDALVSAIEERPAERLLALPLEAPSLHAGTPARPPEVTVTAADGSQIYPDRHVEPTCFLLNVGRIAFQYGTLDPPLLASTPRLWFRGSEVAEIRADGYGVVGEEVVSALRDEMELAVLFRTAEEARVPGRPILAMSDGTLIRWMLRGLQNRDLEHRLLQQYTDAMEGFRRASIPLCSYISMPGNAEVANMLGLYAQVVEGAPDAGSFDGVTDRWLFERHLAPGERSALFMSRSLIQQRYPPDERICFFYLRTPDQAGLAEVARVEVPAWVAAAPGHVDLVHAVVSDECQKGRGYPIILSEAHEQAVIRGADRAVFYELMEAMGPSADAAGSLKRLSKLRPIL